MTLRSTLLSAAAAVLAIALATPFAVRAQDSGFKMMMTPKWTGFPYFEAARQAAARMPPRSSATSSSMPAPTMPTSRCRSRRCRTF